MTSSDAIEGAVGVAMYSDYVINPWQYRKSRHHGQHIHMPKTFMHALCREQETISS